VLAFFLGMEIVIVAAAASVYKMFALTAIAVKIPCVESRPAHPDYLRLSTDRISGRACNKQNLSWNPTAK